MSVNEEGTHVELADYVKNLIEPQIALVARARCRFRTQFSRHRRSATLMASMLAIVAVVSVAALPIQRDYSLMSPRASIMVLPFRNASNDPERIISPTR